MSLVMHEFIRSRDQVVVKKGLTCKHGVVSSLTSLKTPTHNSTITITLNALFISCYLYVNAVVQHVNRCMTDVVTTSAPDYKQCGGKNNNKKFRTL